MKFFFLTIFFLNNLFSETVWHDDSQLALNNSKEQNKVLLIYFRTNWCGYCKKLDKTILLDEQVSTELEKMTLLKIDGDIRLDLVKKYEIKAYPSFIFLDSNQNLIESFVGSPNKDTFLTKLEQALAKKDLEQNLILAYHKNPERIQTNFDLGNFYFKNQKFKKSEEFFRNVSISKDEEPIEQKSDSIYLLGISLIQQSKFLESNQIFQFYSQKYPNSRLDKVYFLIGISFYKLGENSKAKENLLKAKDNSNSKEQIERINEFLNIL